MPRRAPQTHTWTVDTTAPDTSITATPSDPSSSSSADFSFTSTEGGSTFECRMDGGSFASCTSPASYTGLADGSHTFRVRATDAAANTDSSAAVFTWTVDATAPGGGLTDPGSPLRGTVSLSASPSDTGVGVQQVVFQSSPANAGTWSPIGTDTTSPYTASWDTTGVADGLYDLRIVVTDNASNTFASTVVEDRLVDNTNPTATMNDPGANLRGTVNLTSTTGDAGSGVATVTYQRSPAGAGTWTNVAATWNTTSVADGLYDLRVRVTDNAGNVTTSASVDDRRVDNTAPTLSSSAPSDGSKVGAAGSLTVTANEDLADVFGSALDGSAVAGAVSGSTVTFTQAFAAGPHTLSGELEDLAGNRTPIRVHFTVWNTTGGDYPYIEKNSFASSGMTVAITNGNGQLHIPAGAWSGAPVGDWLVARVDPRPAGAVSSGFAAQGDIYDVSAYWALAGGAVTSFDEPIDLTLTNGAGNVVPAILNGSAWLPIARLSGTTLPGGTQRGFYKDGDTVHLLTRGSGTFTLLRDLAAPKKPKGFKGKNVAGRLVLSWKAPTDNSGLVDAYLVYANGTISQTVPAPQLSADMGAFSLSDKRSFQVAARDAAGNVSGKTSALVVIPKVARLSLAKAKTALSKRGLKTGKISYVFSSVPKGSVVAAGKSGLATRGSSVPLKVSKGLARDSNPSDTSTPPPAYQPPSYSPPPPPTPPPTSTPPTDSPPTGGESVESRNGGSRRCRARELQPVAGLERPPHGGPRPFGRSVPRRRRNGAPRSTPADRADRERREPRRPHPLLGRAARPEHGLGVAPGLRDPRALERRFDRDRQPDRDERGADSPLQRPLRHAAGQPGAEQRAGNGGRDAHAEHGPVDLELRGMTREAGDAEEEADDEVRPDGARGRETDTSEEGRHAERPEDEPHRAADQADDRACDHRREPRVAGPRRRAELEEKLHAVPEERGGDPGEEERLGNAPAEIPAEEGREHGGRRHPRGDAPVHAPRASVRDPSGERGGSADRDVRPGRGCGAPRGEDDRREPEASEHEPHCAAQHARPERGGGG